MPPGLAVEEHDALRDWLAPDAHFIGREVGVVIADGQGADYVSITRHETSTHVPNRRAVRASISVCRCMPALRASAGRQTFVPGHHHGMMCEERLRWLDDTLSARRDCPTLIFMHHPPFRTGVQWMDASGLHGGRTMEEIVRRHRQVVRVACGHIHRPIHVAWGGTIASTSPSTCHQVALNLAGQDGFEFTMEPRAVQLHVWDDSYGLVSHLSYFPDGYEEVSMLASLTDEARAKLLAQNRHDYQALCKSEYDR